MLNPESLNYDYSFVEVWEDAKFLVETIAKEKHPTLRAKEHIKSLHCQYETFSHKQRGNRDEPTAFEYYILASNEKQTIEQCTLMCAYFMVLYSRYYYYGTDNRIVKRIMGWIKEDITNPFFLHDIEESLKMDNLEAMLTYDYNYWEGKAIPKDHQDKKDTNCEPIEGERLMQLKERIAELEKQLEEKDAIINNKAEEIKNQKRTSNERTRDKNAYDKKVVAKILLQLLIQKSTYGILPGKMDRAKLISRLSGFSEEALKKLTDPDKIKLDPKVHNAQVIEAIELLKSGDVTINLSFEEKK